MRLEYQKIVGEW